MCWLEEVELVVPTLFYREGRQERVTLSGREQCGQLHDITEDASVSKIKESVDKGVQVDHADVGHLQDKLSRWWWLSIVFRDLALPSLSSLIIIYIHRQYIQELSPHRLFQPVSVISMIRVGRVEERERG